MITRPPTLPALNVRWRTRRYPFIPLFIYIFGHWKKKVFGFPVSGKPEGTEKNPHGIGDNQSTTLLTHGLMREASALLIIMPTQTSVWTYQSSVFPNTMEFMSCILKVTREDHVRLIELPNLLVDCFKLTVVLVEKTEEFAISVRLGQKREYL